MNYKPLTEYAEFHVMDRVRCIDDCDDGDYRNNEQGTLMHINELKSGRIEMYVLLDGTEESIEIPHNSLEVITNG